MAYLLTIYEDNATINTNYVGPNSQLFLINIHGLGIGFRDASFLFAEKLKAAESTIKISFINLFRYPCRH